MTDATNFEREFYCLKRAAEDVNSDEVKTALDSLYPYLKRNISADDMCIGKEKTIQNLGGQTASYKEPCTVEEFYQIHKDEYLKGITPSRLHIVLKPCPLCGATDSVIHVDKWKGVYIKCSNCPMQVRIEPLHQDPSVGNYLEGLIEAWNKRVERDV